MNSKISLFNRSIVKSDFKRFWWVSALEFLFALMLMLAMVSDLDTVYRSSSLYDSFLMNYMSPMIFIQLFVPVVIVVLAMSYLNKGNSVSFMHSLPLGRRKLFASHMLSAFVLMLAPIILCCAALALIMLLPGGAQLIEPAHIAGFGVHAAIYAAFAASATAVVCILSGNMIFSFVLTYIFAALPALTETLLRYIVSTTIYGYPNKNCNVEFFLWLYKDPADAGIIYFIGLIAAAVLFLALAGVLLKKRSLENHGEVVAFPKLKPIFTCGVAIFAGALGYVYFSVITNHFNLLYLIPFGVIGIVIANMLNKKQLTVKGAPRAAAVYTACIVALFLVFSLDLSGYEKRIPTADEVASAEVYLNYHSDHAYTYIIGNTRYTFTEKDRFTPEISGEDIDKVIALHDFAVKTRPDGDTSFEIYYKLKNGKSIHRRYNLTLFAPGADEAVKPVAELTAVKAQKLPLLNGTAKDFTSMYIYDQRTGLSRSVTDTALMRELTDALIADTQAVSYEDYLKYSTASPISINVEYEKEMVCSREIPKELEHEKKQSFSESYRIRPSYIHTFAVLEKYSLLPQMPAASAVSRIELDIVDSKYNIPESDDAEKSEVITENTVVIRNEAQIAQIYDYVCANPFNTQNSTSDNCIVTVYFDDPNQRNLNGSFSVTYDISTLPDNIRELL